MGIMTPLRWIVIPGIWLAATQAHALGEVNVIYADAAGYGFNDTTAVTAAPGNSATTLGQQRKNAMEAAAKFWGDYLNNKHPITIQAKFLSNGNGITCSAGGGTLAYAGASTSASNITVTLPFGIAGNVTALPKENTSYPVALAEELADNPNLNAANKPYEIEATFNASIGDPNCISSGGWYYGYGDNSATTKPAGHSSFYETARHELAHGLGFSTGVSQNGKKSTVTFNFQGTAYPVELDDPYMANLKDTASGKLWPNMNDAERAASALSNPNLVWSGAKVTEKAAGFTDGKTGGQVRMHAPSSYRNGSSVSHFDTTVSPDELMEADDSATTVDTLTRALMCDIGWKGDDCSVTTTTNGSVNITGTAQVDQTLTAVVSDSDGFGTVTYQWLASGAAISGATGATYVVQQSDLGKKITVKATYSDNANNAESPTSAETAAVTAASNRAGSVSISGTAQVGQTLTAAVSDPDGTTGVTISYQWLAGLVNISGANASTYILTANELNKTITVKATYTDQRSNSESLTSVATAAVTAATAVIGDADGSGALDVNDIVATLKQVFSGQAKTPGADYDGNGTVDVNDIVAMLRRIFSSAS